MIRTNFSAPSATGGQVGRPAFDQPSRHGFLPLLLAPVVAVTVVQAILKSQSVTPLELAVWRPLLVFAATLAAATLWSRLGKRQAVDAWSDLSRFTPLACLVALAFALSGVWPQSVVSAPLSPVAAVKYLVTLGLAVADGGPDGFLRGLALALAVLAGWRAFVAGKDLVWALVQAASIWLVLSAVWLLPSVILWVVTMGTGSWADARNALVDFSRMNLNSYWINLQMVRWFTGFGEQLAVSYALFAAAWVWAVAAVLWSVSVARGWWRSSVMRLDRRLAVGLPMAVAIGMTAAWSRGAWSVLDIGACLVWVGVLALSVSWYVQSSNPPMGFWFLVGLGSMILGWPVAVAVGVMAIITQARLHPEDCGLSAGRFWSLDYGFWVSVAIFSFAFIRRGLDPHSDSIRLLVAFLALALPVAWSLFNESMGAKRHLSLGVWVVCSTLAGLALWTFAPAAAVLLVAVVAYLAMQARPNLAKYLPWLICFSFWILLVAVVWIPRLLNPKLVPMP